MKDKIAVVDDHADSLEILKEVLSPAYDVETFPDPLRALEEIRKKRFSAVVTDVKMPGLNGVDLMNRAIEIDPTLPVILITAFGTLDAAASTIKAGAFDYLSKPLNLNEIRLVVTNAVSHFHVAREAAKRTEKEKSGEEVSGVVGKSEKMLKVFKLIGRAAPTNSAILIQGESGTGKEIVARSIHANSPRANRPFIPLNIAAIPEQLLEAELFGHEKGAFTGALFARDGLFSEAEGGTLFLDEIGEIPPPLQPKLLRVLQEHEVRRIGSSVSKLVDVRIIAATNRNLEQLVSAKLFREDLFYRLSVIRIDIPPLRERREDIPLLVQHFMTKYNRQHGKQVTGVSDETMAMLLSVPWPGNVRELENFMDRAIALATGPVLASSDAELPTIVDQDNDWTSKLPAHLSIEELETQYMKHILEIFHNNYQEAAAVLKVNKSTLYRKLGRPTN